MEDRLAGIQQRSIKWQHFTEAGFSRGDGAEQEESKTDSQDGCGKGDGGGDSLERGSELQDEVKSEEGSSLPKAFRRLFNDEEKEEVWGVKGLEGGWPSPSGVCLRQKLTELHQYLGRFLKVQEDPNKAREMEYLYRKRRLCEGDEGKGDDKRKSLTELLSGSEKQAPESDSLSSIHEPVEKPEIVNELERIVGAFEIFVGGADEIWRPTEDEKPYKDCLSELYESDEESF